MTFRDLLEAKSSKEYVIIINWGRGKQSVYIGLHDDDPKFYTKQEAEKIVIKEESRNISRPGQGKESYIIKTFDEALSYVDSGTKAYNTLRKMGEFA